MIQSSRTFRVFVSSTFSDLKEERNALQEQVFPRLRELCDQHGCRFQAIDLRWGVSEEAALDQQTMRICLEEIDRCQRLSPRPNFIVLLGDRYGWQPLPYEISATEYDALTRHLGQDEITLVDTWYRLDENAVPPVYDLLPRDGEFEEFSAWEPVERELLALLRTGFEKSGLTDDARLKYFSSATEQEIYKGALDEPGAEEHVFCFFRGISNLSQDNTANEFIDLVGDGSLDTEAHERLTRLKERLRNDLPGNVHEYNDCRWNSSGITTAHIDQLCEDVYQELSGIITEELGTLQQIDPFEQEIADHAAFAEERACHFTGRAKILEDIRDYFYSDSYGPLVLHGVGGSGKSTLMAKALKETTVAHSYAVVVSRFIGATPSSSNIFSLLESLCRQISQQFGTEATIPSEYKELVEEFHKQIAVATEERPLILFIDALDQLSDAESARNLTWLPVELPNHVKVILSVLNPSDCLTVLQRRIPETNHMTLAPLTDMEGEELLDLWLADAGRTLQQAQKEEILGRFRQCSLPLYLKLAFEEVRKWKSFRAGEISGADIQGIILEFLGNLADEARHGEVLVKHALGYLAAGKNGLTEEEMLDLLSLDNEVKEAFWRRSPYSPRTDKLPVVLWSRLYLDLKPYLTERSADNTSVMSFFHRQFWEVVKERFLTNDTTRERHVALSRYFGNQPYWNESEDNRLPNIRMVSELPYQLANGELWLNLATLLSDYRFIQAKAEADRFYELQEDYKHALLVLPETPELNIVKTVAEAVIIEKATLMRFPELTFQSLTNICKWDDLKDVQLTVQQWKDCWGKCNEVWLERLNLPKEVPGKSPIRMILSDDFACQALAFSHDGKYLAGAGLDSVVIWDMNTGKEICDLRLPHSINGGLIDISWSQDGKWIAAIGFLEGYLAIWEYKENKLRYFKKLHEHGCSVSFCPRDIRDQFYDYDLLTCGSDHFCIWYIDGNKEEILTEGVSGEKVLCLLEMKAMMDNQAVPIKPPFTGAAWGKIENELVVIVSSETGTILFLKHGVTPIQKSDSGLNIHAISGSEDGHLLAVIADAEIPTGFNTHRIARIGNDHAIILLDHRLGQPTGGHRLKGHVHRASLCSATNRMLTVEKDNGMAILWTTSPFGIKGSWQGPAIGIKAGALGVDEQIAVSTNGSVLLLDGERLSKDIKKDTPDVVQDISFSSCGNALVIIRAAHFLSAYFKGDIAICANTENTPRITASFSENRDVALSVAHLHDSRFLTGHMDGTVKLWMADGTLQSESVIRKETGISRIRVAKDGDFLAICSGSSYDKRDYPSRVHVVRLSDLREIFVEDIGKRGHGIRSGNILAFGGESDDLLVCSGSPITVFKRDDAVWKRIHLIDNDFGVITGIDWSPYLGGFLFSFAGESNGLGLLKYEDNEFTTSRWRTNFGLYSLSLSNCGRYLAFTDSFNLCRICEFNDDLSINTLAKHYVSDASEILASTLSWEQKLVAFGDSNGDIHVFRCHEQQI